jgi:predicted  nucleic acid-binding Zn-ribbon protein
LDSDAQNEEKDQTIEDLKTEVDLLKQSVAQLSEELREERVNKKTLERNWHRTQLKI